MASLTFNSPPEFDLVRIPKSFIIDYEENLFQIVCDIEPLAISILNSYGDTMDSRAKMLYLSKPITSYYDVVREVFSLRIANKLEKNYVCDSIVQLISWKGNPSSKKCELSFQLATEGNLYDYCGFNLELEEFYILHESIDGDMTVKYSFLIRLLFTAFALNFIADLSHNDLRMQNILVEKCSYEFVLICFYKGANVESILVPSFGVRVLMCGFGMASQFSTTNNQWSDFDYLMNAFEGRPLSQDNFIQPKIAAYKIPHYYIDTARFYHEKLMELRPDCTTSATQANTFMYDLTYLPNEDKPCACNIA